MSGRLFTGPDVHVRTLGKLGTIVGFRRRSQAGFTGAWWVDLQGSSAATVAPGTVSKVPATIRGAKLDDARPPVLQFGTLRTDSDGRGWICAEVTCDPAKQWGIVKVEIVQVADPDTNDGAAGTGINAIGGAKPLTGSRARAPLAMLRKRSGGGVDVFQIAYFDLQMRIAFAADNTPQRFFFFS